MKIAIVTGASSGMGREFVRQLYKKERFDEIWAIARREDRLEQLKAEVPCVRPIALDLTAEGSVGKIGEMLSAEKPTVSVLVNCSGFGKFGSYRDIPTSDALGMIDLNCKALVNMTYTVLPYMPDGARIAQLDSLSSFQPVPYLAVYGATKAFVLSFSRALNAELRSRNITVTAVCPGWVATEFFDRATQTNDKAVTYFNVVYKPEDVIRTAVRDMYRGKDVSIHGFRVKSQVLLVKLLPHKLVMSIWLRQQKLKP